MLRGVRWIACGVAMLALSGPVHGQEIVKIEWQRHMMNNGPCYQDYQHIGAGLAITVKDWHALQDMEVVKRLISPYLQEAMNKCPTGNGFVVTIDAPNASRRVVEAVWRRETGQWKIESAVAILAGQEQAAAQAKAAAEEQQRQQQQAKAEKERLMAAARADCGASAVLSGGPWFSSTYKIAAGDEAKRAIGRFLCVKSVEYVSAAPNPFGGNAARAKFTGYDAMQLKPLIEVRDFAY
jgi:hypothetical protein